MVEWRVTSRWKSKAISVYVPIVSAPDLVCTLTAAAPTVPANRQLVAGTVIAYAPFDSNETESPSAPPIEITCATGITANAAKNEKTRNEANCRPPGADRKTL